MKRIRYKYRPSKEGFLMDNVKCPICKSIHKNWIKVVQNKNWNGTIVLLAECWTGDTNNPEPQHLYLIEIEGEDLPRVEIQKIKS